MISKLNRKPPDNQAVLKHTQSLCLPVTFRLKHIRSATEFPRLPSLSTTE